MFSLPSALGYVDSLFLLFVEHAFFDFLMFPYILLWGVFSFFVFVFLTLLAQKDLFPSFYWSSQLVIFSDDDSPCSILFLHVLLPTSSFMVSLLLLLNFLGGNLDLFYSSHSWWRICKSKILRVYWAGGRIALYQAYKLIDHFFLCVQMMTVSPLVVHYQEFKKCGTLLGYDINLG